MAHLVVDCQVIVRKFPILTNSGKPKLIAREQYLRPASEFIQFTKDSIAVIIDQHVLFDWIELISDLVNSVPECPVFVITDSTRMNFRKSRAFRVYKAVAELIENDQKKRFLLFPDLFCLEAHNLPDIEHQGFEGYDLWQETNSIWKSIEILKQQGLKMVYAILNKKSEDLVRINAAESSDMKYITIEHLLFRVLKLDIPRIKDMHKSIEERIAAYEEERKMAEDEKDERSSVGYKKYASDELIKSMIESKEAFRGFFRVKKYNPKVAIVEINSEIRADGLNVNTREILICNRFDRNRSIDGDEVVVRLFDQRKWKNFHDSIESDDLESKDNLVKLAKDDEELGSLSSLSGGPIKPCGEIISILNRNMRSFVATLDDMELEESSRDRLICIPIDKRIPKIRIRTKQGSDLAGKRIVVAIDDWNIDSRYPEGHYLYTLGEAGKFITETQALLIENCIRHFDFKNENLNPFLSELPKSSEWKESCPLDALSNRKDLRNSHFVMSIDPPGCRDIDDALSVKELENGNLEFAVHIADVTYFLKQDSPLDLEARSRGTTVYLVNRPYNMLPEVLSEDVCSLHEGKDRLVVSVFWEVDPRQAYKMIRCYMSRSVIRSKFALSYYEAQNIIDGDESSLSGNRKNAFKECRKSLCSLLNFGRILRADRSSRGSLDLDSLEALYEINREAEDPDLMVADVRESKDLEIHHTVAEFMILANMAVAEFIYSKNPTCSLLRRHPVPEKHKFKDLSNILSANSLSLDTSSAISLARSLDEITTKTKSMDPYIAKIIKFSLIRLMSEAKYFSTGSLEKGEFLHYGLAGEYYTHFT
jgi:VacB/RNase II family 3'-5' exoribonuclease